MWYTNHTHKKEGVFHMEENMIPNEIDEAVEQVDTSNMTTEDLKEAVKTTMEKVRNDAMVLGYKVACQTIVQMLAPCMQQNTSKRELERSIKRVVEFASKALKQKENESAKTVQN
jgi:hypothetical protein